MTVARTCYKRVPVVREVTETHMVAEVQTRMVPVVHWRMVTEQKTEQRARHRLPDGQPGDLRQGPPDGHPLRAQAVDLQDGGPDVRGSPRHGPTGR